MHRLDLLLSLVSSGFEELVLLLNPLDLALDVLLPIFMELALSLLVVAFELPDVIELSVFFDFKKCLFDSLC